MLFGANHWKGILIKMRAILQRANKTDILINGTDFKETGSGLAVFLGVMEGDTKAEAEYLARKIVDLRIFKDDNDKLNLSLRDIHGDMLIVSNFTLSADCKHGRRPSFEHAAKGETAQSLYNYFVELVQAESGLGKIETGEFGAHMHINVANDGPVNIIMDTDNIAKH